MKRIPSSSLKSTSANNSEAFWASRGYASHIRHGTSERSGPIHRPRKIRPDLARKALRSRQCCVATSCQFAFRRRNCAEMLLPDSAAVKDVLWGTRSLGVSCTAGTLVIDTTTADPRRPFVISTVSPDNRFVSSTVRSSAPVKEIGDGEGVAICRDAPRGPCDLLRARVCRGGRVNELRKRHYRCIGRYESMPVGCCRTSHRSAISLAKRRHDTFTRDAHVRLLQPRAESLSEFDSEMQWFESRRPSQPVQFRGADQSKEMRDILASWRYSPRPASNSGSYGLSL